jgi:hypothetical protein
LLVICTSLLALENYRFGVQTHFGQFHRADMDSADVIVMLDSLQAAGVGLIRDECYWADVERDSGHYRFPEQIDFYVRSAADRDIEVLMLLDYNNPLYAPHAGSGVVDDSNRVAFARYCRQVVNRYVPMGVLCYEIWNEPNIPIFWDPQPDAEEYARLLKTVYPVLKEEHPEIHVLGCATSPAEGDEPPFIDWLTFLHGVKRAGGLDYLDAVSVHFYRFSQNPEIWIDSDMEKLQNIIGPNIPVWVTECGYPTSSVWPNVSLHEQAFLLLRTHLLMRQKDIIKSLLYYDLKNDGPLEDENEHNFGLLHYDFSAKPAFRMVKWMKHLDSLQLIAASEDPCNLHTYRGAGDTIVVAWTTSGGNLFELPVPAKAFAIRDMYGELQMYSRNHDYTQRVSLSQAPLYLTAQRDIPPVHSFTCNYILDTLVVGRSYDIDLSAFSQHGEKILLDEEMIDWKVSGDCADIDSRGLLIATKSGAGEIVARFENAQFRHPVVVLPAYEQKEVLSFNSLQGLEISWANFLSSTNAILSDSLHTTGPSGLKIDYSMQYISKRRHRIEIKSNIPLIGEPKALLLDFFNDGNPHFCRFRLQDRNGQSFTTQVFTLASTHQWQQILLPIEKPDHFLYPLRLTDVWIYMVRENGTKDEIYQGTVAIDNLRIASNAVVRVHQPPEKTVEHLLLVQNYPNPFNLETTFHISLPQADEINLILYNVEGGEVAKVVHGRIAAGEHHIRFSASHLSSGVYFYRLSSSCGIQQGKLLLIK